MKEEYKLSHLKELEAESIHIIRDVAAEFENPVMLYSIGKDSSVMVRLAEKAFAPGHYKYPTIRDAGFWGPIDGTCHGRRKYALWRVTSPRRGERHRMPHQTYTYPMRGAKPAFSSGPYAPCCHA